MHTPSGKRQCSEFELTKRMPSLTIHNADTKMPDLIQRNLTPPKGRDEVIWHLTSARC
jgi:hypothetical protein